LSDEVENNKTLIKEPRKKEIKDHKDEDRIEKNNILQIAI
jgi:hypothetical protein